MTHFDRIADRIAEVFASAPWFAICVSFIAGWISMGFFVGSSNETWHLWLNSPTTGLTFLGMFALHNTQHRFEKATNERLCTILKALKVSDPVEDEGQQE